MTITWNDSFKIQKNYLLILYLEREIKYFIINEDHLIYLIKNFHSIDLVNGQF